ncbi:MAG: hypothetical protein KJ749_05495, partial [Planctomycetes bacterium]|nr:hypothetical protein [Planctomycetota bacterium]
MKRQSGTARRGAKNMAAGKGQAKFRLATVVLLLGIVCGGQAMAQLVEEDFDAVTGSGGGVFLEGLGSGSASDWDNGIAGESAVGETSGLARVQMSAQGLPTGGVAGTGGGELAVILESLNMVDEDFDTVTGVGGGVFLTGNGVTPNLTGSATDWDTGI